MQVVGMLMLVLPLLLAVGVMVFLNRRRAAEPAEPATPPGENDAS